MTLIKLKMLGMLITVCLYMSEVCMHASVKLSDSEYIYKALLRYKRD